MNSQENSGMTDPIEQKSDQRIWRQNLYKRIKISVQALDRLIIGLIILILLLILYGALG